MKTIHDTVTNPTGIHARPAAFLAQTCVDLGGLRPAELRLQGGALPPGGPDFPPRPADHGGGRHLEGKPLGAAECKA